MGGKTQHQDGHASYGRSASWQAFGQAQVVSRTLTPRACHKKEEAAAGGLFRAMMSRPHSPN